MSLEDGDDFLRVAFAGSAGLCGSEAIAPLAPVSRAPANNSERLTSQTELWYLYARSLRNPAR